ncbi:MAG TPA: TetR/AcrR family transcriptional regulator [Polyangiales bacterium]
MTSSRPTASARARREPPAIAQPATSGAEAAFESRTSRRKRETRERLLDAAFRLMAERGMDAVAINEITEAADVGFGSFYNHFASKEEIYAAVIVAVFESFGDALDQLVRELEDPAEVIAVSIRQTLIRARHDPLWGQFLVREGTSDRARTRGLGPRLRRDLQKGVEAGRFKIPDPDMAFITVGGGVLAAVAAQVQLAAREAAGAAPSRKRSADIPERAAATLLHALGLSFAKADALARRPLPSGGIRNPFPLTRA